MDNDLLGYRDAAQVLGIAEGTLRALVCQRRVPHVRFSPRLVRFNRGELQAWIHAHAVRPRVA